MDNDGKYLETAVKEHYDTLKDPSIVLHRFNDSTAGRNLTAAQPADFFIAKSGASILLECKSTQHPSRLPKFAQHPRMLRWGRAGVFGVVLVHHYKEDVYRLVEVADLAIGKASFDLKPYPTMDFNQAMKEIFG
jgi:hypothetical protein